MESKISGRKSEIISFGVFVFALAVILPNLISVMFYLI